jgi:hypothetical protein
MGCLEGCECEECTEGEEPDASFSYEQTDDDPCTIDLFDESTVHENCDGEIVEWKWYLNEETTPFSTSQNPTDVEVEDGDDIRLWVKDSCGCTDEVVMAIVCVELQVKSCSTHSFILPTYMTVDFPAVTNGTCGTCAGNGGSRILKLSNATVGTGLCPTSGTCCIFQYDLCKDGTTYPIDNGGICPDLDITGWILSFAVPIDGTSNIIAAARLSDYCGGEVVWRSTSLPWQSNFTSFSTSLPLDGPHTNCNDTAGTTADVSV